MDQNRNTEEDEFDELLPILFPVIMALFVPAGMPFIAARLVIGQIEGGPSEWLFLVLMSLVSLVPGFLGRKMLKKIGREFLVLTLVVAPTQFFSVLMLPYPKGNSTAIFLGGVVTLAYLYKIHRDFLAGKFD